MIKIKSQYAWKSFIKEWQPFGVEDCFNRRLFNIPNKIKSKFPYILRSKNYHRIIYYIENKYILIAFFYAKEFKRINLAIKNNQQPFPGLISEDVKNVAAFKLKNKRNILIENCIISDRFSFSNCKDSTFLIKNHRQKITTDKGKRLNYKINLAFLVFLGNNIKNENLLENLDNLISFAVNKWILKNN